MIFLALLLTTTSAFAQSPQINTQVNLGAVPLPRSLSDTTDHTIAKLAGVATELTLSGAITRSLTNNPDIINQKMALRTFELNYDDAWDRMFLPQISFNLGSNSAKTVGLLPGNLSDTSRNEGYPTTTATVSLGQYTLFNFGKDKLVYEMSKLDWKRAQERFDEFKRSIKFQVINAFWTLKSKVDKLDAYERSVEIAQAMVNLQESRALLNKASWTDVSSSTVDLMNVKNLRDQAQTDESGALFALNVLLGDPVGTKYNIKEEIVFLPIKVTEDVLYQTYLNASPNIKNARKDYLEAQMQLELTEKNLLPLPTVQFSGLNVGYGNNFYGGKSGVYSGAPGQKNIDISAGISFSLPLMGPGGLFGTRNMERSQIALDQSELSIRSTTNQDQQTILQFVQNIRQFELTVENNKKSYQNSMIVLQSVFTSLNDSKVVSRLDIRDALNQARDSEINLSSSLISHLFFKTQLAAFIGVDYLPRME